MVDHLYNCFGISLQKLSEFLGINREALKKTIQRGSRLPDSVIPWFSHLMEASSKIIEEKEGESPLPVVKNKKDVQLRVLKLKKEQSALQVAIKKLTGKRDQLKNREKLLQWLTDHPPKNGYDEQRKLWIKVELRNTQQKLLKANETTLLLQKAKLAGIREELNQLIIYS